MPNYEIEVEGHKYKIEAPSDAAANKAAIELRLGMRGEEIARRRAPAPTETPVQQRSMAPGPGASLGDVMAWKENAMDLGRSAPQTPQETASAGKGALTGLAASGVIAAPMAALRMAGSAATGMAAGEATDYGLRKAGVPGPIADVTGNLVELGVGAGAIKGGLGALLGKGGRKGAKKLIIDFLEHKLGKKAAKKAATDLTEKAAKQIKLGGTVGSASGNEIVEKITTLGKQGLSKDQIASSLRQLYGIGVKDAKQMISMVMGG